MSHDLIAVIGTTESFDRFLRMFHPIHEVRHRQFVHANSRYCLVTEESDMQGIRWGGFVLLNDSDCASIRPEFLADMMSRSAI